MYAIEFETDIQDGIVKIPEEYRQLKNKHARVVILVQETLLDLELKAFSDHSAATISEWKEAEEDEVWR